MLFLLFFYLGEFHWRCHKKTKTTMNSTKKSQYFRFMNSKKKKRMEPGEKIDIPGKATKVGQKTISAFFAPKVAARNSTEKAKLKVADDEGLKRKLEHFKSDENVSLLDSSVRPHVTQVACHISIPQAEGGQKHLRNSPQKAPPAVG